MHLHPLRLQFVPDRWLARSATLAGSSYGEGDEAFAGRLARGLEEAHVTCRVAEPHRDREPGLERGPDVEEAGPDHDPEPLRRAQALVFVAAPAACSSPRCRAALAAARALRRPQCPLDDELQARALLFSAARGSALRIRRLIALCLQGYLLKSQFADFTTDELLERGLAAFAHTISHHLSGASTGAAGAAGAAEAAAVAAAAAVLALPGARCDPEGSSPFLFVWFHKADAAFAGQLARGLAHRRAPCWLEHPGVASSSSGSPSSGDGDEGARAVVKCAAFVPILSPAAAGDPSLRDRLQLAELNQRLVRPIFLADSWASELEDLLAGERSFVFFAEGNVALLATVDELAASVPRLRPPRASGLPGPAAVPGAQSRGEDVGEAGLAERQLRARVAAARRRVAELEARLSSLAMGSSASEQTPTRASAAPALQRAPGRSSGSRDRANVVPRPPSKTPPPGSQTCCVF
eukprot:tig00000190_g13848.t1